jgi:molybdopterin converting factor small subunit
MSRVFMPQILRTEVGGVKSLEVDGSTVGEVVRTLVAGHPGLGGRLLTPGQDVRYLDGPDTPVAERDEIRLLPAIAGGAR